MKKQQLPSVAMFMICIIIMFPFCSSAVMADISVVRTYDENNVEGFMKTGGDLTVEAYAGVEDDETITPEQLKLSQIQFTTCGSPDPERIFKCLITMATAGFILDRPSHTYTVSLYDDTGDLVDEESATVTFDDLAPVIDYFSGPSLVGRGSFDVSYAVRDPTDLTNRCSGIGRLEIYLNAQASPYAIEQVNSSICSKSGAISIEGSALNDGANTIKLVAYDRMGHTSPESSISLTSELAEVSVSSIALYDQQDNMLEWFDTEPTQAYLVVNFSGPSLKEETVLADMSDINSQYYDLRYADSCSESESITTCRWDNIVIDIDSAKTAAFEFQMEDYAGNDVLKTGSLLMRVDTQGPSVTSLRSENFAANINYARPQDNKFIARIVENAVLDKDKIRFYIGNISKRTDNYFEKPEVCEKLVTGSWECNFTGIDLSSLWEDGHQAFILNDSTDKYDNPFVSDYSIDFIMDSTPPELLNLSVRIISGVHPGNRTYVQMGDSLEITATLLEKNALGDVYGDFSTIISESYSEIPACTRAGVELWECKWETDVISLTAYKETSISFSFSDAAGNSVTEYYPIEVMGVVEADWVVWNITAGSPSPLAIDRQIATLYEPFMWFPVFLKSGESGIIPVEISVEECFSTPDASNETKEEEISYAGFLTGTPELYNYNTVDMSPKSSYSSYLKFNLIQAALEEEDALKITCIFKVIGIKDQMTVVYSADMNASFEIKYFNNPIGTIDENVDDEIERVKGGWLVGAEWLGMLDKWMSYGRTICGMFMVYQKIMIIWTTVHDISASTCSGSLGIVTPSCAYAKASGQAVEGSKGVLGEYYGTMQKFCNYVNCKYSKDKDIKFGEEGLEGILQIATGQYGPIFDSQGKDRNRWFGNLDDSPQSSLVLSILYLCIPAIIYNLQKARAIDCIYINCLKMVEQGMPISLCTSQRGYAYCKFVYGEIFHLIPFAATVTRIGQNVLKALSHPFEAIGFLVNIVCKVNCESSTIPFCWACSVAEFSSMTLDVLCDLGMGGEQCEPIWEQLGAVQEDACEAALADEEDEEEEEES